MVVKPGQHAQNLVLDQTYPVLRLAGPNMYQKKSYETKYILLENCLYVQCQIYKIEKSMFLVPQVPQKYRLGPSRFFGIHLVPQVSKPDKFGPKPYFEHVDRF